MVLIALIGPRGAGKSSAGKQLAKNLGLRFLDLDFDVMFKYIYNEYLQELVAKEKFTQAEAKRIRTIQSEKDKFFDSLRNSEMLYRLTHKKIKEYFEKGLFENSVIDIGGRVLMENHRFVATQRSNDDAIRLLSQYGTIVYLKPNRSKKKALEHMFNREMTRPYAKRMDPEKLRTEVAERYDVSLEFQMPIAEENGIVVDLTGCRSPVESAKRIERSLRMYKRI